MYMMQEVTNLDESCYCYSRPPPPIRNVGGGGDNGKTE
jgi:hypothetical protein